MGLDKDAHETLSNEMRTFASGATRNTDQGKLDYEGFLSPKVLKRFAEYMHKNRYQADGKIRDSDNWQKGIPYDAYIKSAFRHFMEWWEIHRPTAGFYDADEYDAKLEEALCALMFNTMGYLHEHLKEKTEQ